MRPVLVALALALTIVPGALRARDLYAICPKDPGLAASELVAELERRGVPAGALVDQSPQPARSGSPRAPVDPVPFRRLTLEHKGRSNARVHLFRMARPPFLSRSTPEIQSTLDSAKVWFGFLGPTVETGAATQIKALTVAILASRSGGFVYDSGRGQLFPAAAWEQIVKGEEFEYPAAVRRAVLRCASVPATPSETVSFAFVDTSQGAVAFDTRHLVRVEPVAEVPPASIESGTITTGGYNYRIVDLDQKLGGTRSRIPVRQYALVSLDRGTIAIGTDRVRGSVDVDDLQVQLVPQLDHDLPEIVIESTETLPRGAPRRFLWLGPGGRGPDRFDALALARAAMRGGPLGQRENGVRALARIAGADAVSTLVEVARAGRPAELRQLALKGLAERPDGLESILELTRSRGADGAEVVRTLRDLGRPDTRKLLLDVALSHGCSTQARIESLLQLRTRIAASETRALTPLLDDPLSSIRILAADAILRKDASAKARTVLVEELQNLRQTDVDHLVGALRRHKIREAVPYLLEHLPEARGTFRSQLLGVLTSLAGETDEDSITDDPETVAEVVRRSQAWQKSLGSGSAGGTASTTSVAPATPATSAELSGMAAALGETVRVTAKCEANLAPLQVLQFLSERGFVVGLAQTSAGPDARPVDWDVLKIKDQSSPRPFLELTQAVVKGAGGADGRVFTVTCRDPRDPRAVQASAWAAWLLASRAQGMICEASGRCRTADDWVRNLKQVR